MQWSILPSEGHPIECFAGEKPSGRLRFAGGEAVAVSCFAASRAGRISPRMGFLR